MATGIPSRSAMCPCADSARAGVPRVWRFLGGLAAIALAIAAQHALNERIWLDVALLGAVAVGLWLWLYGRPQGAAHVWMPDTGPVWCRQQVGAGMLLAALGLVVWLWLRLDVYAVTTADWLWYLVTVVTAVTACAIMQPWRGERPRARGWLPWVLLIIVASAVRLWQLDIIPFGTWYDEAANGLEAMRVAREPDYRPIYTDGVNATGHYLWLIVGAFQLWGEKTVALRWISALMGVATAVTAYGLGNEVYGRAVGVTAAGLMATAHWSVTFSRMGMYNAVTPLAELATLWFLARGLRRNSPLDYGLAGLSFGLGLCFYSAFQLFAAVLGVLLAWLVWQERRHWRRLLMGLALMTAVAGVVIAPVVKYAMVRPESYFARVQNTSLLRDRPLAEGIPALVENARKHVFMFNVRGDPNGRHNLPGSPLLDTISGGLLVLGTALAVCRAARLEMALLPIWVLVGLMGGILSLGFEAPQSLRSIAAQPAIYFLVALPLGEVAREWSSGAGRLYAGGSYWLVAAFLLPIAFLNTRLYFTRQTSDFASWNAYSTPETLAAHTLRNLDGAQAQVISLYDQHPTVRFLAPGVRYARLETNATLPLLQPAVQDWVLILDAERRELFEMARRIYPNAAFEEQRPPFGGPVVNYVARIDVANQMSVQGLTATYRGEGEGAASIVRQEAVIDAEWPRGAPLDLPFVAEWEGVLAVEQYGLHQFVLQAPAEAALYIGEAQVAAGDASGDGVSGAVVLARGNHNLRVWAEGGEGQVVLAWRTPNRDAEVVPAWVLYVPPVQSRGLLGRYYANGEWQEPVTFAQIDPQLGIYFHVPVLPRPYTVEWVGKLAIPEDGMYLFGLESVDESVLFLDGQEVAASHQRDEFAVGEMALTRGLHDIRVRYADRTDHTYIRLYWRTPNQTGAGGYEIIPSDFLFPPQSDYTRIEMPALPMPETAGETEFSVVEDAPSQPAHVEVVVDGLNAPRGVAVGEDLVYIAESGAGRVLRLDLATSETTELTPGEQGFVEPMDVAVDGAGNVFVLDAEAGRIDRFDASGAFISSLAAPETLMNRARGIDVDGQGRIWVASTPAQQVVALDAGGAPENAIINPAVGGTIQAMQPVDVAALEDGSVYVTDASNHRLYHFDSTGFVLSSRALPVANSLDGSHLARAAAGHVYVTEPESGRVVQFDEQGMPSAAWSVRTAQARDAKPVGIAVDRQGNIWVADVQGGRVLRVTPAEP